MPKRDVDRYLSRKRNVEAFHRGLVRTIFQSLIATGQVDPTNKSDEQLMHECVTEALKLTRRKKFHGSIDLRSIILNQARAFAERKETSFAVVFYATWFEHWINNLLTLRRTPFPLSSDQIKSLLFANIEVKFLTFPAMLQLPPIAGKHVRAISSIAGARNQFLHYKYRSFDLNESDPLENRLRNELPRAEPVLRYLNRYENRYIFKKTSAQLRRLTGPNTARNAKV